MGLPRALKAHAKNDVDEALVHYQRAFDQGEKDPRLYQNYGALLVKIGKTEDAEQIYSKGIALHPNHVSIHRNYANLLRRTKPSSSIYFYLKSLRFLCATEKSYSESTFKQLTTDIVEVLHSLECNTWAYAILREVIASVGLSVPILKDLVLIVDHLNGKGLLPAVDIDLRGDLFKQILASDCTPVEQFTLYFAFAFHYHTEGDNVIALDFYNQGMAAFRSLLPSLESDDYDEIRTIICENSWNFACIKLQMADFDGWSLFDHGLQARAIGKQRWQRALTKPFTDSEITVWRGESLVAHSILLLEEQAIGDVMMFINVVPKILKIAKFVGLYISKRLYPIYLRTFEQLIIDKKIALYVKSDVVSGLLNPTKFHYQSPLGSTVQYLFDDFQDLANSNLKLLTDVQKTTQLYSSYRDGLDDDNTLVIGISWRGGGRADRIKQKSLEIDEFTKILLANQTHRFVSLQYGDSLSQCSKWRDQGINIIHDDSINALKDMDAWLAQVEACDAVISVANTTIHGAGGLNKPTVCLLSNHSDWRWFNDRSVLRSYWYPSVSIARQSESGDWSPAISSVKKWINDLCPYPSGHQFV